MPRTMKGQITRIKNGNWQIRVQSRIDGIRKSVSESGFSSRSDAKEALDTLLADIKTESEQPSLPEKNFDDLFDAFLEIERSRDIEEQTYYLYERIIRTYLRPEFGKQLVKETTTHEIEKFLARLHKDLSGEMVWKIYNQFKRAFKKAKSWKWIIENPFDEVPSPRRKAKAKSSIRNQKPTAVFTPNELEEFLNACPDDNRRNMYLFFALTGCRPQEVFAARWQDVDNEKMEFSVNQALVQTKEVKKFGPPKTEKSKRIIPLPDELLEALKKHKVEQNKIRLKTGSLWVNNDLIFPTRYGKPQRLSNLGEKINVIKSKTGIDKNITPKSFRKTYATIGRKYVLNRKAVSDVLGHDNEKITDDFYVVVERADQREASETIVAHLLKKSA